MSSETQSLEGVMQQMWRQCATSRPTVLVVDPLTLKQYEAVAREERQLREVCTPLWLKRLFPGIQGFLHHAKGRAMASKKKGKGGGGKKRC